jgi:hypothetical protein
MSITDKDTLSCYWHITFYYIKVKLKKMKLHGETLLCYQSVSLTGFKFHHL